MDRNKALSISGFDERNYPVSDYDFWIRWIQKYEARCYFRFYN
ncbi:glycosyltransferase-like domain protein [Yersinia pestis PY-05]|nr:glycosyltransferase-like domain protein [Yersinia pestis PY-05]